VAGTVDTLQLECAQLEVRILDAECARLRELVEHLEAERASYRELAVEAMHALHRLNTEYNQARRTIAFLREARRQGSVPTMAAA
jgi:hypothetical protein